MKNLLSNATEDFRRINPHLFQKNDSSGLVARPRGIRKGMNKTEREYSLILAAQLVKGEITGWLFEGVKLRIGEGCWYTPDFFIWTWDRGVKFVETKGFLRDDARVKFLSAKEQHKWASFEMVKKTKMGWVKIL